MSLFGKKTETACCCSARFTPEEIARAEKTAASGGIRVLGGGCAKCHALLDNTRAALAELGIREDVELITDFAVIAEYGVMSTPALAVGRQVVSCGKVLKTPEIAEILRRVRG